MGCLTGFQFAHNTIPHLCPWRLCPLLENTALWYHKGCSAGIISEAFESLLAYLPHILCGDTRFSTTVLFNVL